MRWDSCCCARRRHARQVPSAQCMDPIQISTTRSSIIGYFESDPLGTVNSGQWGSTLVRISDDTNAPLAAGATHLLFEFYAVDNTRGQYRDPFAGVNPFTGIDDGLTAAFVATQDLKPRGNAAMGQPGGVALPCHTLLRCRRTLVRADGGRLRSAASPVGRPFSAGPATCYVAASRRPGPKASRQRRDGPARGRRSAFQRVATVPADPGAR
jgi:hypothetical protein